MGSSTLFPNCSHRIAFIFRGHRSFGLVAEFTSPTPLSLLPILFWALMLRHYLPLVLGVLSLSLVWLWPENPLRPVLIGLLLFVDYSIGRWRSEKTTPVVVLTHPLLFFPSLMGLFCLPFLPWSLPHFSLTQVSIHGN